MEILSGELVLSDLTSKAEKVLVVVSSQWCGPCKALQPILEEIETTLDSTTKFIKVDVTSSAPQFVRDLRISKVPTLLLFKNGELKKNETGGKTKEAVIKFINI